MKAAVSGVWAARTTVTWQKLDAKKKGFSTNSDVPPVSLRGAARDRPDPQRRRRSRVSAASRSSGQLQGKEMDLD